MADSVDGLLDELDQHLLKEAEEEAPEEGDIEEEFDDVEKLAEALEEYAERDAKKEARIKIAEAFEVFDKLNEAGFFDGLRESAPADPEAGG